MQRNFVFTVLIDCALASLIAIGKIVASEIFVFSRAVEDAVDMVLMRSRSEAELAQMTTEINKLTELSDLWTRQKKEKTFLTCRLAIPVDHKGIILRNLHYSRGTASVRADHVELPPGIYALTGANGSGKVRKSLSTFSKYRVRFLTYFPLIQSTLFRVLMSCNTNEQSTELPPSINLLTPMEPFMEEDDVLREKACILPTDNDDYEEAVVDDDCESGLSNQTKERKVQHDEHHPMPRLSITMPSSHVVEISQNFYWPLYSKPIEWIFFDPGRGLHELAGDELDKRSRIVAEHLHSLEFFQTVRKVESEEPGVEIEEVSEATAAEATISRIQAELLEEKEDWFGDLSGGQKSKVELVRKVFLLGHCPEVLLVDETMAPLDPASKAVVMAKLKDFCSESIVIVIYHTDVGREVDVDGKSVDCVPSNDFFDSNIHLESGKIQIRATC
jgi:ABC-type Mn2+/Zn2+ transport system ATPase subunit